jgi:hypothetical protein
VLIAYRLWTRQGTIRDSRKAFGLTREARIMAESGAIYAITVILIIATYTTQSNSFNVFLDVVSKPHLTLPSSHHWAIRVVIFNRHLLSLALLWVASSF